MISILSRADAPSAPMLVDAPPPPAPVTEVAEQSEWVVGPPQMTALAFVGIAAVALFSGLSYVAGKASLQLAPLPPIKVTLPQPQAPVPSIGDQFALYQADATPKTPDAPIFADPAPGKSYIQMAAVEKGVAAVFAEGLRTHNLTAFVAPGPDNRIFRVLIGPVSDPQTYKTAKQELDKIGLATFMRQYEK